MFRILRAKVQKKSETAKYINSNSHDFNIMQFGTDGRWQFLCEVGTSPGKKSLTNFYYIYNIYIIYIVTIYLRFS